jgi:cbb3-type cytochrome c oxidase subunit II
MRINPIRGWRGVALIAITYVYFLIFAQFAFLTRLAELGIVGTSLQIVMTAMAIAGVLASLLATRSVRFTSPVISLRIAFAICGIAAFGSLLPLNLATAAVNAFLIGIGLGLLTVTLVSHLRDWTGTDRGLIKVGIGTGIGYFLCNVPALFTATPAHQAIAAAALCIAGLWLAGGSPQPAVVKAAPLSENIGFIRVLAGFAALVWLDSAAFYIIQHTSVLKAGTWMGTAHLWMNACIHLSAALVAALLLRSRGLAVVLACAFCLLAAACSLLANPGFAPQASLLYPAGVSLYSTALVAYPSFLRGASSAAQRGRQAGLIYAIAGWIGSALGIGMGQNLGHVPLLFVAVAGAVVLAPVLYHLAQQRTREVAALGAFAVIALALARINPTHSAEQPLSALERGRRVYISEGCINCHSQYVRPNTLDVLMWGPVVSLAEVHQQKPPLIGNRRQGPDLTQVGVRRSRLWLKAHLIDPAEVSGRSVMPSFGFLFNDERGDDLVAYLASLHTGDVIAHHVQEQTWKPSPTALMRANAAEGAAIYRTFCSTCHDAGGATRQKWAASFTRVPADLKTGPFRYVRDGDANARAQQIAHIAKFGIAGTDMPGHEYLDDEQIASVSLWLANASAQTSSHAQVNIGDKE